jgi:AcrR family transcriptional regulator
MVAGGARIDDGRFRTRPMIAMTASPPNSGSMPSMTRDELHALVWTKPLAVLARDFGVSRNGLAKSCDRQLIPYPGPGYWTTARRAFPPAPPPLPPAPANIEVATGTARGGAGLSRRRTRLSPEARRDQLVDAAGAVVAAEGVHAATLKRVAREAGVSEAQAHNHFGRRTDLLIALARRELEAMNAVRESEIERGHDNLTRVTLSTIAYLRQVERRGVLIQRLLALPEVRQGLRAERAARARSGLQRMTERLNRRYGLADDLAYGATAVLTAVCLRAGRLLAERKIPLEMAERLSLAIVTAGNRAITRAARSATPPVA